MEIDCVDLIFKVSEFNSGIKSFIIDIFAYLNKIHVKYSY